ncbi:MAG: hypothetical protein RJA22_1262 [Verrucomicrobiota bacterium]|jgi:glucokinase
MTAHVIGIEIGGTKLQAVAGTAAGQIVDRRRFAVDRADGRDGILRHLAQALEELRVAWRPVAGGVGFGGPIDWRTGRIACSHHVAGWTDFPLGPWVAERLGVPVRADNDANVASLGEALCGAGAGFSPVFYVTLGSGVGGGLVVDGRIYHGAHPGESEIGHVRLDRSGVLVEDRCSGWAMDGKIRRLLESGAPTVLRELAAGARGGEARFLGAALAQGDMAAQRLLRETAGDLAFGLSHVVHLMHPSLIVLGGGLSLVGEPLRQAVAEALPGFLMEVFRPGPGIRLAGLGEDAVPVGALRLAGGA